MFAALIDQLRKLKERALKISSIQYSAKREEAKPS
jgi:hypothetical protein